MLADEVATLCTVFEHVGVIAEPAHLSGKRRGNCVLLASAHPLPEGVDRVLRSDPVSVRLARSAQVQSSEERRVGKGRRKRRKAAGERRRSRAAQGRQKQQPELVKT